MDKLHEVRVTPDYLIDSFKNTSGFFSFDENNICYKCFDLRPYKNEFFSIPSLDELETLALCGMVYLENMIESLSNQKLDASMFRWEILSDLFPFKSVSVMDSETWASVRMIYAPNIDNLGIFLLDYCFHLKDRYLNKLDILKELSKDERA